MAAATISALNNFSGVSPYHSQQQPHQDQPCTLQSLNSNENSVSFFKQMNCQQSAVQNLQQPQQFHQPQQPHQLPQSHQSYQPHQLHQSHQLHQPHEKQQQNNELSFLLLSNQDKQEKQSNNKRSYTSKKLPQAPLCSICNASSTGIHFGVEACAAC